MMMYEWLWSSSGMILSGENQRTQRKACPSVTLPTTNPTWTALGLNLAPLQWEVGDSAWTMTWPLFIIIWINIESKSSVKPVGISQMKFWRPPLAFTKSYNQRKTDRGKIAKCNERHILFWRKWMEGDQIERMERWVTEISTALWIHWQKK